MLVRGWVVCSLIGVTLAVGAPPKYRMDAPAAGTVETEVVQGDRVTAKSPWWQVGFDLRNGGVLDSIVFPHGSGRNVLVEPVRSYVGPWSDANAPKTEVRTWSENGVRVMEFSGRMASTGRIAGPVGFRTTWRLSAFSLKAEHTLVFDGEQMVARAGIGSMAIRGDLNEYGVRVGPETDKSPLKGAPASYARMPGGGQAAVKETHAPAYLFFFARGVEGFDLTTGTDLAAWESGLSGRGGVGRFEVKRVEGDDVIRVWREPVALAEPVKVAKGEYTFSYFVGLPQVVERSNRRWRHMAIRNNPWPTDEQIAQWAADGVNIIRVHNDFSPDGDFWRDGAWPPYDAKGMAELRRVIAACKRNKVQIVPYFSLKEFHPEAQGYRENLEAWKRSIGPMRELHDTVQNGEYGAQMCMESGWLERRKKDVEQAYRELGFDGIYYDWVATQACDNPKHAPGVHLDTDAVIDMLAWTRRLLGHTGGPLVLHVSGWFESIAMENYADLVVNVEEFSSKAEMMDLASIPVAGFQAEVLPRSPCPTYRKDNAVERSRNNAALAVVLGMFPHALPVSPAGVETLKMFRLFKPYAVEEFRFRSVYTKAVQAAETGVVGALYSKPEVALVVVSNTNGEARKGVAWRLAGGEWPVAAPRVRVEDLVSGGVRTVARAALEDGSMSADLGGYEYRVFEVTAARE